MGVSYVDSSVEHTYRSKFEQKQQASRYQDSMADVDASLDQQQMRDESMINSFVSEAHDTQISKEKPSQRTDV